MQPIEPHIKIRVLCLFEQFCDKVLYREKTDAYGYDDEECIKFLEMLNEMIDEYEKEI